MLLAMKRISARRLADLAILEPLRRADYRSDRRTFNNRAIGFCYSLQKKRIAERNFSMSITVSLHGPSGRVLGIPMIGILGATS
jgi:hypothetical protein